jgi:hypothetical protein
MRGVTLSVYDDGGARHYEFSFEAWRMRDVADFTGKVLKSTHTVEWESKGLPFQRSSISETFRIGDVIEKMVPAESVEIVYRFPSNVVFHDYVRGASVRGSTVAITGLSPVSVSIGYSSLDLVSCLIAAFVALIAIVAVLIIAVAIKKRVKPVFQGDAQ